MRALTVAVVSGVALAAVSAHAAPLVPKPDSFAIYMPDEEWAPLANGSAVFAPVVSHASGWVSRCQLWFDRWGYQHWRHCRYDW